MCEVVIKVLPLQYNLFQSQLLEYSFKINALTVVTMRFSPMDVLLSLPSPQCFKQ